MKNLFETKIVNGMKIFSVLMLTVLTLTGCGGKADVAQNEYEQALLGKWAYIHEPQEMVAVFKENGSAEFEKSKYQFSSDGQFINLVDDTNENLKLRYLQNNDKMYVYIQGLYTREEGTEGEGIVGVWRCEGKNWTFEFSAKGTFMEEGAMTGYYEVDEAAGTVKLMYGEALEDTIFYYKLTDEGLFVEYPWLMIKMSK